MFRKNKQENAGSPAGSVPQAGAPRAGALSLDEFWRMVGALDDTGATHAVDKTNQLRSWLGQAGPATVAAFDDHLQDLVDAAYRWPLWAAAYLIKGSCEDDCFTHFRSGLVFMGRELYESALEDPDILMRFDDTLLRGLFNEDLLYVAMDVYEEKTGNVIERDKPSPVHPAGEPWYEDDPDSLKSLCPNLYGRFHANGTPPS